MLHIHRQLRWLYVPATLVSLILFTGCFQFLSLFKSAREAPSPQAEEIDKTQYGTIAGMVFQNEKLMANYEVQVVADSGLIVGSAKTNNQGHFIIQDIPPGSYKIQVLTFAGVPATNFNMTIQVRAGRTESIKINLGGPKTPEPSS